MALVNLQFIQYNNYFNKILRKPANPFLVTSYNSYPVKKTIISVAFNENDGVTTYQVVDKDIDDVGDYLLVHDGEDIFSHWFVTEAKRNRLGQCMVTLQRDLLVDYYETIKSAPAFIERGMLSNDDPMIFNDEGLSFNQVKKQVEPLYDDTHMAWIVGYMAKESDIEGNAVESEVTIASATPDYTYDSWASAPQALQDLISGTTKYYYNSTISLKVNSIGYIRTINEKTQAYYIDNLYCNYFGKNSYNEGYVLASDFILRADGTVATGKSTVHSLRTLNIHRKISCSAVECMHVSEIGLYRAINDNYSDIEDALDLDNNVTKQAIDLYNGKIVSVAGTLYKIELAEQEQTRTVDLSTASFSSDLLSKFISVKKPNRHDGDVAVPNTDWIEYVNQSGTVLSSVDSSHFSMSVTSNVQTLSANQLGQKANLTFPTHANRQETIDAQYDMFAIPLPLSNFGFDGTCKVSNDKTGTTSTTIYSEVSISMAQKLAVSLGIKLYDLQVLPYCPFKYSLNSRYYRFVLPSEGITCKYITVNGITKSFIYFCDKSEFDIDVYLDRNYLNRYLFANHYDIPVSDDSKTQKSTMKYRLSGGNYASMFDFTPDMNGGVKYFKAYCNYKPYKPFVKVNPLFGYLYGDESFKDANGLILSGDFSFTIISDAWTNYLIQNKNFEAMFDRQIQTVEKTNDVTLMNSKFSAVSGAFTGTATGAIAGGMKGGVYGAIAGAVVGGATSSVGGAVDVNNQAMLLQDNLDLQRQMHSYQVDNIKALPDTIQKVSALTIIDKIVPILEVFDCTSVEKQMFSDYIRYNGMSVGRIDKIGNFESNGGFIQGRFIRLEGLSEDYHLANALNTTFQAGFYFEEV